MRRLALAIGMGLLFALVFAAALFGFERALLFPKPAAPGEDGAWRRAAAQRLWVEVPGGRAEAW